MFKNDLRTFINDRLDDTVKKLEENNINYNLSRQEYCKLYDDLYNEITDNQKIKLEKLVITLTGLNLQETEAIYITAIQDVTRIENKKIIDIL